MNLWSILLTGLTTGGLSCLAIQGGILASVIANQKETELADLSKKTSSKKKIKQLNASTQTIGLLDWLPVLLFLCGKLFSHTMLGFFLGFLGSKLELSLTAKLFFQGIAVLFMFATAMNLLGVHPIFRYIVFQPPKFITRLVRNSAKSKAVFSPFLIGILTLFIPCGVTQSMEILAMTSGNPLWGAAIMGTFVLGTFPLFGLVGLGVAKLSKIWKQTFLKITAVLLLFVSMSSLNGILVVLDAPITLQKLKVAILDPAGLGLSQASDNFALTDDRQRIKIDILNNGYSPNHLVVKAGIPVELTLESKEAYTCASDFVFPAFGLKARLEPNDSQILTFSPTKKGRYTFSCSMGMYTGIVEVI